MGGMRALLSAFALALCMSASATVALADGGDDEDTNADKPDANDPGIAALHEAISERQDFMAALRTECPNNGDAKCRTAFKAIRDSFKEAQQKAIEEHHAFKEEQKKTRDEAKAKAKAKDAPKKSETPRTSASPKPSESPRANSSTKPAESPRSSSTPKPSESPRR